MEKKPVISYQFVNVSADKQELVKDLVQRNLEGKMDTYFKKVYANKDTAEIRIEYKVTENKQGKYEWSFHLNFDGKTFDYKNKVAFKFIEDVVNHAFVHFKELLSDKSEEPRKAKK